MMLPVRASIVYHMWGTVYSLERSTLFLCVHVLKNYVWLIFINSVAPKRASIVEDWNSQHALYWFLQGSGSNPTQMIQI